MSVTIELQHGEQITLEHLPIRIGSDGSCDLRISNQNVRPQHAQIRKMANRWLIESQGEWDMQVGDGEPGRTCWLQLGDRVRLTPNGPEIVFQPPEFNLDQTRLNSEESRVKRKDRQTDSQPHQQQPLTRQPKKPLNDAPPLPKSSGSKNEPPQLPGKPDVEDSPPPLPVKTSDDGPPPLPKQESSDQKTSSRPVPIVDQPRPRRAGKSQDDTDDTPPSVPGALNNSEAQLPSVDPSLPQHQTDNQNPEHRAYLSMIPRSYLAIGGIIGIVLCMLIFFRPTSKTTSENNGPDLFSNFKSDIAKADKAWEAGDQEKAVELYGTAIHGTIPLRPHYPAMTRGLERMIQFKMARGGLEQARSDIEFAAKSNIPLSLRDHEGNQLYTQMRSQQQQSIKDRQRLAEREKEHHVENSVIPSKPNKTNNSHTDAYKRGYGYYKTGHRLGTIYLEQPTESARKSIMESYEKTLLGLKSQLTELMRSHGPNSEGTQVYLGGVQGLQDGWRDAIQGK